MVCEPDVMRQELTYLALLTAFDSASVDTETTTVKDADGNVVLVFLQSPN
ncbi:MAG: META domain-containing protein [Acidobacteria bacterium]|nr:MAG: META domain-containing protein [Acidobacteriota bacterium]